MLIEHAGGVRDCAPPFHNHKMNHFKSTTAELMTINKVLDDLIQIAIDEGISPAHTTHTNALQKLRKRLDDYRKIEQVASTLGYSSLPNALKALRMVTTRTTNDEVDSTQLPEVFHKVPSLWLSGRPPSKRKIAFPPMSVRQAERKHRVIAPLLIEAWVLSSDDESIRDKITTEYLSTSADEFEKTLYRYIHDLEEVSLEEEFTEIKPDTDLDLAESLRLVTHPDVIYGVVKKTDSKV